MINNYRCKNKNPNASLLLVIIMIFLWLLLHDAIKCRLCIATISINGCSFDCTDPTNWQLIFSFLVQYARLHFYLSEPEPLSEIVQSNTKTCWRRVWNTEFLSLLFDERMFFFMLWKMENFFHSWTTKKVRTQLKLWKFEKLNRYWT